ncbi:MAG: hypothetical protein FVQ84_06065 [Planctomycetes bacterium]|nr:hypothetical protein [Planctomycetota bacterium]
MKHQTLAHFRHFSSLFTNFPSTNVENSLQITPFYAKQTQFQKESNERNLYDNNEICKYGHLVIQKKQTQFKANKAKNKPNSKPNKANWSEAQVLSLSKETNPISLGEIKPVCVCPFLMKVS